MKLHIEKDALLQGAGRTQGVIDRRGHTPILSHCLLEAGNNQLKISATDYEVSFSGYYPAQVEEEGGLTVPAVSFYNILRELPAGTISLESTENSNLVIQVGDARYQFLGLPVENFPPLPKLENQPMIELSNSVLSEMLEKTIFSIAADDIQPHLTGVLLEKITEDGRIIVRLVSSDGHRLSLIDREIPAIEQINLEKAIIIPRKGVAEMLRLISEEERCALGIEKKSIILRQGDKYLYIRLLDKKYPDYRRIIPASPEVRITVGRRAFLDVLKRISLLSAEKFKGVIMMVSEGWLDIRYHNPEIGGGDERLPITVNFLNSEVVAEQERDEETLCLPIRLSYNARYLIEPLSVMQSDEIYFELTKKKKPLCLRDANDPKYLSIVMPMDL
ncbi:DNA polymerase III subunit beta [Desulfobacca acetoxidans]|uniref:Beta sliding clamp n=1 Tax=Desulfobacca acetoxidans (strain ATCC 700848 / DSM 11109 / ASRB2) TaxID=880072 RepID=F2NF31_DESAR|nr:DNA polymerase III subunit beta [Desulfobacca acetoxidans]AEB08371.1 DNA polymerase III, beta subunit [Desulfobacca acetoxidans DSM 11109]